MIWLIKSREKTINFEINNSSSWQKKCMEPAEKYISRMKKIKAAKLTPEVKSNIYFHLYQLIETYVDCKIISKWLSLESGKEKIHFFYQINNTDFLKQLCNIYNNDCSIFEYENFSDLMKTTVDSLLNEYVSEFKKAFENSITQLDNQEFQDELTKVDAINSLLSFYLNQGTGIVLRILPTGPCEFDLMKFKGSIYINFDFITGPITTYNKKPILDNLVFYEMAAKESLTHFLALTRIICNSEHINENFMLSLKNLQEQVDQQAAILEFLLAIINKKNKEGPKMAYYRKLEREELINKFYEFYKVPSNFLDILQTQKFEGKILLSQDYQISKNFQTLIITYLDEKVIDRKDIDLIKVLFNISAQNPQSKRKKYETRLDEFKKFIKLYAEN